MKCRRAWFLAAAFGAAVAGCSNNSWSSGDRVLVSKIQYESGIRQPSRFDVVVFKYPGRAGGTDGPIDKNVPKNYIKRLLGLPGELIAIFFGRLFRLAPPVEGQHFEDHLNPALAKTLWQDKHMRVNENRLDFQAGRFEIIRKTPDVMLAMRRIVNDNDHQPKDMAAYPRWAPNIGSGWTADKVFGFRHSGAKADQAKADQAKADQVDWLHYQHLVLARSEKEPIVGNMTLKPSLITDFMGYNAIQVGDGHFDQTPAPNWVGDLMLECQVEAVKGEGQFWLELSKGIHRFQACWDLGSGMCTLFKNEYEEVENDGKKVMKLKKSDKLDSQPTKLRGPGTYQVKLANCDARLTVWVDKELPFGDGKDYPPPEVRNLRDQPQEKDLSDDALKLRRGPTRNDLEPASVGVSGADVKVQHMKLWRDTYYTLAPSKVDVNILESEWSDPEKWGPFREMQVKTLYVQPGHYLCLGDNSPASSDSRDWGLVPERLMLGRALLVYYPFHRAGPIR